MNAMELDKTNSRAFFDAVVPRSASKRPLDELLQLARATPKFQHNPLANIDIGHNSIYVVYSPPQSAKTGVSTGLVMGAAVHDKPLVSIIFTQNKMIDIGRFVSSCRHYNADFKKCANALGCSHGSKLVAVRGDVDEFKKAMDTWVEDDEEMPVFLALQNADHVRKAQDVMQHVDEAFEGVRDEFGRINVQIIFDEGDLAKKGQLGGEDSWEFQLKQRFSSAPWENRTILEMASSLAYVTATPQALLVSDVLADKNRDGRKFVFCEVPVSSNYCGFTEGLHPPLDFQKYIVRETLTDTRTVKMKKRGRKGKEKTVEAVLRTPFYDYVSESDKPLSAMVYSGSDWEANKVPRKIEASKVAVDYRKTEGFWTMSWSSGETDVYTASPYIKKAVLLMKKFKKPVVVHSSMEGGNRVEVVHFASTKKGITDYPTFVTALGLQLGKMKAAAASEAASEHRGNLDKIGFFKSILFGTEMINRGVSICGERHERHLDCALVILPKTSTHEYTIQVVGRICAVIKECEVPDKMIVFAPATTHEIHKQALQTSQFCIKMLKLMAEGGPSIAAQLDDLKARVEAAEPGETVSDQHDVVHFLLKNLTRAVVQKQYRTTAIDLEDIMESKAKMAKGENDSDADDGGECETDVGTAPSEGGEQPTRQMLVATIREWITRPENNGRVSFDEAASACMGYHSSILPTSVQELIDDGQQELGEQGILWDAENNEFCIEEEKEAEKRDVQKPPPLSENTVAVNGAERESGIPAFVSKNKTVLRNIFRDKVRISGHRGVNIEDMATLMAHSKRFPSSPSLCVTDIVKYIRDEKRGERSILRRAGVEFNEEGQVFVMIPSSRKSVRK